MRAFLRLSLVGAWLPLVSANATAQQPLGEAYWAGVRANADSVLVAHFGEEFRAKHIFTPYEPIDYAVVGEDGVRWADRDSVSSTPAWCYFEFDIGLDSLNASRNNIAITITPRGERVPASLEPKAEWNGFVQCNGACRFAHDLDGFMVLAKGNGVRCKRKTAFRELRWIPPDSAAWASGERNGRYELTLGKYHGKGETLLGSSTYSYRLFDAIVFDPFTGAVLRKEQRKETYMIACGPTFL